MKFGKTFTKDGVRRTRTLFCWFPRMGSDGKYHWLETITREEISVYFAMEVGGGGYPENQGWVVITPVNVERYAEWYPVAGEAEG